VRARKCAVGNNDTTVSPAIVTFGSAAIVPVLALETVRGIGASFWNTTRTVPLAASISS
jgi:hypothetical protein